MNHSELRIRARLPQNTFPWSIEDGIELVGLAIGQKEDGERYRLVAKSLELVPHQKYEPLPVITNLATEQAQELMDSLYACGLRPTGAAGSAGQLSSVLEHLKDMREITNRVLKKVLGEK